MNKQGEYKLVQDMLSDNQCDNCGVVIKSGTLYYAQEDDRDILCPICMTMKIDTDEEEERAEENEEDEFPFGEFDNGYH